MRHSDAVPDRKSPERLKAAERLIAEAHDARIHAHVRAMLFQLASRLKSSCKTHQPRA